jgi:hypothetical protein
MPDGTVPGITGETDPNVVHHRPVHGSVSPHITPLGCLTRIAAISLALIIMVTITATIIVFFLGGLIYLYGHHLP